MAEEVPDDSDARGNSQPQGIRGTRTPPRRRGTRGRVQALVQKVPLPAPKRGRMSSKRHCVPNRRGSIPSPHPARVVIAREAIFPPRSDARRRLLEAGRVLVGVRDRLDKVADVCDPRAVAVGVEPLQRDEARVQPERCAWLRCSGVGRIDLAPGARGSGILAVEEERQSYEPHHREIAPRGARRARAPRRRAPLRTARSRRHRSSCTPSAARAGCTSQRRPRE